MKAALILIFLAFAALAVGFVIWPVLTRRSDSRAQRAVLAAVVAVLVLGVGGGVYLMLGSPGLALRSLTGPQDNDLPGLLGELVQRVQANPKDGTAWALLGRGYMTVGNPALAAEALQHAVALAPPAEAPGLISQYGEALVLANNGQVSDEAVQAFQTVLKADPKNPAARYYLGLAEANAGHTDKALAIWQQVLDDAPPGAPYRSMLIDRMAALRSGAGGSAGGPPNIMAMVARLAATLKAAPNDPAGWQRLIRAYSVLGETAKAKAALADARAALKSDPSALAPIEAEARALHVQG